MIGLPRRVQAVDQMSAEDFVKHLSMRHPALKLPGRRYRQRFQSEERHRAAIDAHLEAHRQYKHAHCHVRTESSLAELPDAEPDAGRRAG